MIEPHDVHHEFPDLLARIDALKLADADFAHRCERFDSLDLEIRRVEEGFNVLTDFELEALKKKRLVMKDEIYASLRRLTP